MTALQITYNVDWIVMCVGFQYMRFKSRMICIGLGKKGLKGENWKGTTGFKDLRWFETNTKDVEIRKQVHRAILYLKASRVVFGAGCLLISLLLILSRIFKWQ